MKWNAFDKPCAEQSSLKLCHGEKGYHEVKLFSIDDMKFNEITKKWESPFWHPAVTTDAVVFGFDKEDRSLQVLLIRRGNAKPGEAPAFEGYCALPGGFLQKEETTDECVHRELFEESSMKLFNNESGIRPEFIEQLKTYSARGRDPREFVITVAYYALVKKEKYEIKGGDDAVEARWFPVDVLPELKIAFDHAQIIQDAVEMLRERIHFEPIGFHLLDKEFTMPQLQNIYIAILNPSEEDKNLRDRRNFPKKMLKLGYIRETGKKLTGNPYRSPKLYTFDEEAYAAAKKIGMRLEF